MKDEQEWLVWHNDASKDQQVAIRAYCFELLIANSCAQPSPGPTVSPAATAAKIVASHPHINRRGSIGNTLRLSVLPIYALSAR